MPTKSRGTATPSAIPPGKLARLCRWINLWPAYKRHYGFAYLGWLKGGAVGLEPDRGRLSKKEAENVRLGINAAKPWEEES